MKKAMSQSVLTLILNGVSILSLIFLIISLFLYGKANLQLSKAHNERFELTYNANRFMNGSAYLTNEVRAFAATGAQEHYDNYWNEVNNLKNRDIGVAALQEIGITAEEQGMIDKMFELSNSLVPLEEEAMNQVQNGKKEDALDYVYGTDYSTAITEINAIKEQFLADLDARTKTNVEELTSETERIKGTMIAAFIVVGLIQLFNILLTRRGILRPVISIRDQMVEISKGNLSSKFALQPNTSEIGMLVASIHETKKELKKYINDIDNKLAQMAQGNMNLTIDDDYRGEFLPIQNAMREILDSLNAALSQINTASEQVSEGAGRMSYNAQSLSSGTVQQAAAVEELSSSIQEISRQVSNTSSDAGDAQLSSMEAMKHLKICNEKMGALAVAIEDITKSSREIGGIIKTIEDISFQTNILALNASVEAARAGEAGKGFSVVADEVQSLANKSAESAKNITELIENSIKQVKYGASLSEDTTKALAAVIDSGQKSTELIERIADSATQQAESLGQLTEGMHQISDVVQTNASTAQETAMTAQDLQTQADGLKFSIHKFRLRP